MMVIKRFGNNFLPWAGIFAVCILLLAGQSVFAYEASHPVNQSACGGLTQEAENATLYGGMKVGESSKASKGKYIFVPTSYGDETGAVKPENRADICVQITSPGTYKIAGRVHGENTNSDSLYVYLNGDLSNSYLWDIDDKNKFVRDFVNDRGVSDPQIFTLAAGQHIFSFVHREPNTKLDRIELIQLTVDPTAPTAQAPTTAATATATTVVAIATNTPNAPTTAAPTATAIPETNPQCGGLSQEAEAGVLSGNLRIGNDDGASKGKYIFAPNNIQSNGNLVWGNRADYCVQIDTEGEYQIETFVKAPDIYSDSYFVLIDGSPSNGYLWDTKKGNSFAQDWVRHRGTSGAQTVNLTQGQHTLSFVHRESGTLLDRFSLVLISTASGATPAPTNPPPTPTSIIPIATEPAATATSIPPTTVPATATATATSVAPPSGSCGELAQEAEAGQLFGNIQIGNGGANQPSYIYAPKSVSSNGTLNWGNRADFCVRVPLEGTYQIKAWVKAPDIYSDSYFVLVDGTPSTGYLWDTKKGNSFAEDRVSTRGKSGPQSINLTAGDHTLSFVHRESGTLLDRFEVVLIAAAPNATPINQPPTATATAIPATTISATSTAQPTTPPATPTSEPITPTPVEPSGQCGELSQEAENGTLFGNLQIGFDGTANKGRYIFAPQTVQSNGQLDQANRADFCITVPTNGTYQIKTWVKAPDIYSDSYFVMVDGAPSAGYLWDTKKGSSFAEDWVSQRGQSGPQSINLTAGEHTVSFIHRESGTLLDRFEVVLISSDGGGAPIPTVQPTATTPQPTSTPVSTNPDNAYYVSKKGNNGDGRSWGSAWNELNQIKWSVLQPGDVVFIDGGSSSMTYRTALKPAKSGNSNNPILVQLSTENGRNGQAIFFGGNSVLLPECGQRSWDESQLNQAGENGILFEKGVSNIVVDGRKRNGFVVHGWKADGVKFVSDRINNGRDDNTKNITLRYIEIYNNGGIRRQSDGSVSNLYYPDHAGSGIELSGVGHRFEYLEIHDNSSDAIQSGYTNPSGGVYNNMDDLTLTNSWLYNMRPHSGRDNSPSGERCTLSSQGGCDELGAPHMSKDYLNYPSTPSNRVESFNWCTHSDGIQIFSSNQFNTMTIKQSIIGPNFMTALLLGDRNGSNATAYVDNLTLEDVVITRFMHNALGMKNPSNRAGKNWNLKNVTIYGHYNNTQKGTLQIDSNAGYAEHSIENTVMVHGRTNLTDGKVRFANNCEHAMYSGSIGGQEIDPQFRYINGRDLFAWNINTDFATVFTDDYSVGAAQCAGRGSRITSVSDLLATFNQD